MGERGCCWDMLLEVRSWGGVVAEGGEMESVWWTYVEGFLGEENGWDRGAVRSPMCGMSAHGGPGCLGHRGQEGVGVVGL